MVSIEYEGRVFEKYPNYYIYNDDDDGQNITRDENQNIVYNFEDMDIDTGQIDGFVERMAEFEKEVDLPSKVDDEELKVFMEMYKYMIEQLVIVKGGEKIYELIGGIEKRWAKKLYKILAINCNFDDYKIERISEQMNDRAVVPSIYYFVNNFDSDYCGVIDKFLSEPNIDMWQAIEPYRKHRRYAKKNTDIGYVIGA